MKGASRVLGVCLSVITLGVATAGSHAKEEQNTSPAPNWGQDGTIHVSSFALPPSGFLSAETRVVLQRQRKEFEELRKQCFPGPVSAVEEDGVAIRQIAIRKCIDKHYYPAIIARHRARYKVTIQARTIAGVSTEIITPIDGVSRTNRQRLLINLHGGGFTRGGRWGGQLESIPIAAVGRIKVVSVDYRLAPENQFPAASEDVAAVYKALLDDYRPENIGIYGCSAGGILTAQSVAWFQKEGLPAPGAIGMFCGAAFWPGDDDSTHFSAAIAGTRSTRSEKVSYFRETDFRNPLAFPGLAPEVMAGFPDSLLITSSRDGAMSSVVATHSQLIRLGVDADLHVWEGLGHAFFFEPDFPESREVYDVIVRFFGEHLGGERRGTCNLPPARRSRLDSAGTLSGIKARPNHSWPARKAFP